MDFRTIFCTKQFRPSHLRIEHTMHRTGHGMYNTTLRIHRGLHINRSSSSWVSLFSFTYDGLCLTLTAGTLQNDEHECDSRRFFLLHCLFWIYLPNERIGFDRLSRFKRFQSNAEHDFYRGSDNASDIPRCVLKAGYDQRKSFLPS